MLTFDQAASFDQFDLGIDIKLLVYCRLYVAVRYNVALTFDQAASFDQFDLGIDIKLLAYCRLYVAVRCNNSPFHQFQMGKVAHHEQSEWRHREYINSDFRPTEFASVL